MEIVRNFEVEQVKFTLEQRYSTRGPPCGIMLPTEDFLKSTIFK